MLCERVITYAFSLCRYRPSMLPVWFIAQELEFDSTEDCVAFMTGLDVVFDTSKQRMDCKLTAPKLS